MKWSDDKALKALFVLTALASMVMAVLANGKWG